VTIFLLGTAMLPGMKGRIVKELETLIESPKYEAFKGKKHACFSTLYQSTIALRLGWTVLCS